MAWYEVGFFIHHKLATVLMVEGVLLKGHSELIHAYVLRGFHILRFDLELGTLTPHV